MDHGGGHGHHHTEDRRGQATDPAQFYLGKGEKLSVLKGFSRREIKGPKQDTQY